MKKAKKREIEQTAIVPLRNDELARVSGGDQIVSPRDPASGLPTGKRM